MAIGDDDTINQAFDQWSAVRKGQRRQRRIETAAPCLEALGQRGHLDLLLCLRLQVAQLMRQALWGVGPLRMVAFELVAADEVRQRDFQKPRWLPFQRRQGLRERAAPRWQGLREPRTALGALQCVRHSRRLPQHWTAIRPPQRVECPGWGIPGGAAFPRRRPQRLGAATTAIIVIPRVEGTARTGHLTLSTTDEAAQEGVMGRRMTTGQWGMAIAPDLGRLTGVLADECGHRDGDPCLRWGGLLALPRPHGPQGGWAVAGWGRACPPPLGRPRLGRRPQDATHRGHMPSGLPRGGRDLCLTEAFGDARHTHRCLGLTRPGKNLRHARRLDRINTEAARVAGRLGIQEVALGSDRPRQEVAPTELGMPATSQAIGHERPCGLRHRPPQLQQKLIVRILTHRALQERHLTPPLGACIAQQHLLDIVAGQAIWGGDEDPLTGGHGGPIPSSVQAGPLALGPPRAIIALEVRLGAVPIRLGHAMRTETFERLGDRLGVLLTRGGDPDRESDFPMVPPEAMWTEASCLRHRRWSIAEGTGTPHPTVAPRHSGL